jgi:hypothetical protein
MCDLVQKCVLRSFVTVSMLDALFSGRSFYLKPSNGWTEQLLDWRDPANQKHERQYAPGDGWAWLQGESRVGGRLVRVAWIRSNFSKVVDSDEALGLCHFLCRKERRAATAQPRKPLACGTTVRKESFNVVSDWSNEVGTSASWSKEYGAGSLDIS